MIEGGIEQELQQSGAYMSTTVGYSMWPMLRDRRDTVIIRPVTDDLQRGDVALYRLPKSGTYVLHRIIHVKEDHYLIVGDNCGVVETVPKDRVFGYLDGFYRGEKWIAPDSRGYALYRWFICAVSPAHRAWIRFRGRALRFASRCKRAVFPNKSE